MTDGGEKMRVLYIWDADYPWDVRAEKICRSLTDRGCDVHIAARNRQRRESVESLPEATVHRLPAWRHVPAAVNDVSGFPAFFNPRWLHHLRALTLTLRPHLIIVRDLPLCPAAIHVGRAAAVPIMFDMAENYPAMIRDIWEAERHGPLDFLVRNPRVVRRVEQWCVRRVDHTLAVVEESAERLQREYNMPADTISLVSNTPELARVAVSIPDRAPDSPLRVVYLGIMEKTRGVMELIEAVARLRDGGVAIQLDLVGGGRDLDLFKEFGGARRLSAQTVTFHGQLPHAEALAVVRRAHVGVVPHHRVESTNTTVPNKIFDYMAEALPVVSSDSAPCERILREIGSGLVFPSGDAQGLAAALRQLVDPVIRVRFGANGLNAVRTRYHWEYDAAQLWLAVTGLARRATPAASRPPRTETVRVPADPRRGPDWGRSRL